MEWLECGDDEPMLVTRIHKDRFIGPSFKASTLENMIHIPLRDDDVLVCSYPKSGCHWVWETVRMILAGEVIADNLQKEQMMMELFDDPEDLNTFPAPRVLNNHAFFDDQPSDLLKGKAKVVFVYRNPKDVCVSYYNQHSRNPSRPYTGTFSSYINRFLKGKLSFSSYFEYLKMWERGLNDYSKVSYILLRYEDLHRHPISERRKLATFLGRDCDDIFLQEVTEATNIDSMKRQKCDVSEKGVDGRPVMYRKGKVGDWKDYFTVNQSEMFDESVRAAMGESHMFQSVYSFD